MFEEKLSLPEKSLTLNYSSHKNGKWVKFHVYGSEI